RSAAGTAPGGHAARAHFLPGSAFRSSLSAAELMQYRSPVGSGPSSKTCPRCPSQAAHSTSVRVMKKLRSVLVPTAAPSMGSQKLGHPVPESNLVPDAKSGAPHPAHVYVPSSFESWYSPVKAC